MGSDRSSCPPGLLIERIVTTRRKFSGLRTNRRHTHPYARATARGFLAKVQSRLARSIEELLRFQESDEYTKQPVG